MRIIAIFNRQDDFFERGQQTVQKILNHTNAKAKIINLDDHEALRKAINESCLLVNATSCGMKPQEEIMAIPDASFLRKDLAVVDIVYAPKETKFLKVAREVGCHPALNGEGMMLYQGAATFILWMEREMPMSVKY